MSSKLQFLYMYQILQAEDDICTGVIKFTWFEDKVKRNFIHSRWGNPMEYNSHKIKLFSKTASPMEIKFD
jgi:hypothetical protein